MGCDIQFYIEKYIGGKVDAKKFERFLSWDNGKV